MFKVIFVLNPDFLHDVENGVIRKLRLILKPMTSQAG